MLEQKSRFLANCRCIVNWRKEYLLVKVHFVTIKRFIRSSILEVRIENMKNGVQLVIANKVEQTDLLNRVIYYAADLVHYAQSANYLSLTRGFPAILSDCFAILKFRR